MTLMTDDSMRDVTYNALRTITPVLWTTLLSLDLRISNKSRMGLTYTSFAMVTLFTDGQCGTHPHRRYPVLYNVIASLNTRNRFPCSLPVSTAIRVTIKVTRQRFQFLDKHVIYPVDSYRLLGNITELKGHMI